MVRASCGIEIEGGENFIGFSTIYHTTFQQGSKAK